MATDRNCSMPEEILFEILTRLPVKSVCRFRCVSKLCFSIISLPDFVAAHLQRSRSRPPKLLISLTSLSRNHRQNIVTSSFFSMDYPPPQQRGGGDFSAQPLRATFNSSINYDHTHMISQSPSGGDLICFTSSNGIKIGNPITRDMDLIPFPVVKIEKSFFGLVGNRHVILMIDNHQGYDDASGELFNKSRVFDLVENLWYETCSHPCIYCPNSNSICKDGVIYLTAAAQVGKFCLYAYDVRLNGFQLIQHPPYSDNTLMYVDDIIEYKGCVALVGDSNVDEIRLWVLEDPKKHIWSFKSFVVPWRANLMRDGISSTYGVYPPILCGATHGGELLFCTAVCAGSLYLFLYGIETSTLRRFRVDGFDASLLDGNDRCITTARLDLVIQSLQSPKDFINNKKKRTNCSLHPSS